MEIDYLQLRLRFCQATRMLQSTRERSGIATIGSSSDTTIAKYTWIACDVNLQKVLELLE